MKLIQKLGEAEQSKFNKWMTGRLVRWLFILLLPLSTLLAVDLRSAGGFTPDTPSYLNFDPIRQPLYGLWANGLFAAFGNWHAVGAMQLLMLICALACYYYELLCWGKAGRAAALVCAIGVFLLLKLGVASLVLVLMTEGLFLSWMVLLATLSVRCARRGAFGWSPVALMVVLFALTQLRTAALLTLVLPFTATLIWALTGTNSTRWRRSGLLVAGFTLVLLAGPTLVGKKPLQLGSPGDGLGFALLPRVGQLPLNEGLGRIPPEWREFSKSWQGIAADLDLTEATLFDGQMQEAIRFNIGPKILRPFLISASEPSVPFSWANEEHQRAAKALALKWIAAEPGAFLCWSARHFIATLSAATFASEAQRMDVWLAIRAVDARVWQVAPLRNDYPNNNFEHPLKRSTALTYGSIRVFAVSSALLGSMTLLHVVICAIRRRRIAPGTMVGALGFAWILLHAATVGLTTFPEFRFVFVTLWGYLFFGVSAIALYIQGATKSRSVVA